MAALDVNQIVLMEFLHLAHQSSENPPVGSDNDSLVVAATPPNSDQRKAVRKAFDALARRLGEQWAVYEEKDTMLAFRLDRYDTGAAALAQTGARPVDEIRWKISDLNKTSYSRCTEKVKLKKVSASDGDLSCMICLGAVPRNVFVTRLGCGHWFHDQCIKDWIRVKEECPCCRTGIVKSWTELQQQGK